MSAVGELKAMKEAFKKVSGGEYDANKKPAGGAAPATEGSKELTVWEAATAAGNAVRELKVACPPLKSTYRISL